MISAVCACVYVYVSMCVRESICRCACACAFACGCASHRARERVIYVFPPEDTHRHGHRYKRTLLSVDVRIPSEGTGGSERERERGNARNAITYNTHQGYDHSVPTLGSTRFLSVVKRGDAARTCGSVENLRPTDENCLSSAPNFLCKGLSGLASCCLRWPSALLVGCISTLDGDVSVSSAAGAGTAAGTAAGTGEADV